MAIEDCVELAVRSLEVYVHGSEERQPQAPRGDKVDDFEAASVLKKSEEKEETTRLGKERLTWSVFNTN